jgi:hypothetical protein
VTARGGAFLDGHVIYEVARRGIAVHPIEIQDASSVSSCALCAAIFGSKCPPCSS